MKNLLIIATLTFSTIASGQEVIYHVFERSFYDSNGDNHGDLKGIQQKLDYLQELGVTSLLLTPLYQSEFYHNYFATDFEKIDQEYGTMDDYTALVKEIHRRGMKIYQDVEMQYVAGKHPWYTSSLNKPGAPETKYIYYDDSLNKKPLFIYNIPEFTLYDGSKQTIAVVNLNNPAVRQYTFKVLNFWVDPNQDGKFDDGVDGFRLDHMMDDLDNYKKFSNLFRNFWSPLLADLRKTNPAINIVAEQSNWGTLGREYFSGANVDRVFAFRLCMAIEKLDKKELLKAADSTLLGNPPGKEQVVFAENHDIRRIASAKDMTLAKLKAVAALNLLIGGVPAIYYGQELGMKGKTLNGQTDGNHIPVREAFEWYAGAKGKGMCFWYKGTGPWWDSTNVKANDGISVEEEKRNPGSLYNYYKKIIALRKSAPALYKGTYSAANNDNDKVFSFLRTEGKERVLVIVNLTDNAVSTRVEVKASAGKDLVSGKTEKVDATGIAVQLKGYQARIIQLRD